MTPGHTPPTAADEAYRLSVLASLDLLDTPPEAEFDTLVAVARDALHCPIALVSLIDADRQWFKARCGLEGTETPRDLSFCTHALAAGELLVVSNALNDPRFADNAMVTGPTHIRFYAGMPLRVSPGEGEPAAVVGTMCVVDIVPRSFGEADAAMLKGLAKIGESLIRARLHIANAVRYADERRDAALRIGRQHDQLRRAERIADMGSWRIRLSDERIEWSDQVFAIHGLPVGEIPPMQQALEFFPVRARATITQAIANTIETGAPFDVEVDFTPAAGPPKRVRSMGEIERDEHGPAAIIGVFQDISQRYIMEQALRRSANHDALTGIANRAGFNTAINRDIAVAVREGTPLALILIDLDGFKGINDTHGHAAGDAVLQTVAHRLGAPYLDHCCVAQLGGDEFVIVVTHADDCADLARITMRLLEALRRPIDIRSGSVSLSGTLGVAWHEAGMTGSELLHAADLALYDAKRAGKDRAVVWNDAVSARAAPLRG